MAGLAIPGATPAAALQKNLEAAQSQKELADNQAALLSAAAAGGGIFGAASAGAGAALQAQAGANLSTAQTQAQSDPNMLSNAITTFQKFDKSNVISFELDFKNDDFGNPNDKVPDSAMPVDINQTDLENTARQMIPGAEPSPKWQDTMTAFLYGFLGPENSNSVGPYAVDTRPQNTDIGGYVPPSGPFSGVLLSMAATFTSSPYGQLFGLGPAKRSGSTYFISGYEDRRNRG
jgi:hypothetical protein